MRIEDSLRETGAVLTGHFQLSSGRHSDTYFEKFRLLERPDILGDLCGQLAEVFRDLEPQYVVGPTIGGILIAYETARHLGVPALYLEAEDGKRIFRRGASVPAGARVLLVDDVLTTGLSIHECLPPLTEAEVVGVGMLVSRTSEKMDFPGRYHALLTMDVASWPPEDCPLCSRAEALTERGSRLLRT